MLSDPLSVTVGGSAKSLARGSGSPLVRSAKTLSNTTYITTDGEFRIDISQSEVPLDKSRVTRISLGKRVTDSEGTTTMFQGIYPVSVALEFHSGPYGASKSELSVLRDALTTFVGGAVYDRLLNGEG